MTGIKDFLKDEAVPLINALKDKGIHYVYKCYGEGDDTNYSHIFHLKWNFVGANICNDDECNFFKDQM